MCVIIHEKKKFIIKILEYNNQKVSAVQQRKYILEELRPFIHPTIHPSILYCLFIILSSTAIALSGVAVSAREP